MKSPYLLVIGVFLFFCLEVEPQSVWRSHSDMSDMIVVSDMDGNVIKNIMEEEGEVTEEEKSGGIYYVTHPHIVVVALWLDGDYEKPRNFLLQRSEDGSFISLKLVIYDTEDGIAVFASKEVLQPNPKKDVPLWAIIATEVAIADIKSRTKNKSPLDGLDDSRATKI